MKVTPIKTDIVLAGQKSLQSVLDQFLPKGIPEKSVLAVTSKIVSLCEGRVVKMGVANKDDLIFQESEYFLPRDENPYNVSITITSNNLVATAGIDESNGNGNYILWPVDPQASANKIREFLIKKYSLKNVGVIITDSKTIPLRWGVIAVAIAHSGFKALKNYIGTPDIFGRPFQYEQLSIRDTMASAATLVMGEGNEQQPLALFEELPFVEFQDHNPTKEELAALNIDMDSDIYGPLLKSVHWNKGQKVE